MEKILIIGGSDAGISAALRAKEIDPGLDVTVLVADRFPNFSICGLPFYISGEVRAWQTLAHRTADEIERQGIQLQMEHKAAAIHPEFKTVTVMSEGGLNRITYDKLILTTGASSARPSIPGIDLPGVFSLRWMEDGFDIKNFMEKQKPKSAIILGTGYIGMEMADALSRMGLSVTMLSRSDRVLKTVDVEMSRLIRRELERHGVKILDGFAPDIIEKKGDKIIIRDPRNAFVEGDMVLAATGGQPQTGMAKAASIATGIQSAICVNRKMETNIPDIFAAGDCVETRHPIYKDYTYLPLGTTAHKQGRVAGENAAGGAAEFAGSIGTQVDKIFDLVVGRTGLSESEARKAGFDPLTSGL